MSSIRLFDQYHLRVAYWDQERRVLDRHKGLFESNLAKIGNFSLTRLQDLKQLDTVATDLLIIAADMVPEQTFATWVEGMRKSLATPQAIWVPVLFFANLSFGTQRELFLAAERDNWYFDVIAPAHLESLPLRVANLIRIRNHLFELKRYGEAIAQLEQKVEHLAGIVSQQGQQE